MTTGSNNNKWFPPPPDLVASLQGLITQWRAEGARIDTFHATMGTGYKVCADELDAALAGSAAIPSSPSQTNTDEETDTRRDDSQYSAALQPASADTKGFQQ